MTTQNPFFDVSVSIDAVIETQYPRYREKPKQMEATPKVLGRDGQVTAPRTVPPPRCPGRTGHGTGRPGSVHGVGTAPARLRAAIALSAQAAEGAKFSTTTRSSDSPACRAILLVAATIPGGPQT